MKKTLFLAAAALAMLASCSQNDDLNSAPVVSEVENNAIQFGTYVGGVNSTRATATGNITSAQVLAQKNGFGVFAYYTGRETYNEANYHWESTTLTPSTIPNFMYNQQVVGTNVATPVWSYHPLKYWPNDFADDAVDTQNPAAQGSTTYGGNVSFFAYAPYVAYGSLDSPVGITNMSDNATKGDPTVTYTIISGTAVATTDLLWGTFSGTTDRVVTGGNTGETGDDNASNDNSTPRTYKQSILGTYQTNADLNKQKIAGKVGFAFKHALAGFGGGSNGAANYGFQVQLDIDNDGATITGGTREKFDAGSGSDDAWRTIVTIKDIEISNDLNNNSSIDSGEEALAQWGTLNLATGQWTKGTTGVVKQTIGTNISPATTYNAVLNTKIAEVYDNSGSESTWFTQLTSANKEDYFRYTNTEDNTKQHPGVMETPQDVFNTTDQAPLMLIPGQTPKFRITVHYIVRTYDANLQEKCTMVEQKISKTISFVNAVELNKHYNLIMHLGLTGIKFNATVSDWNEGQFDGDGDGTADDNFVHLPINVSD